MRLIAMLLLTFGVGCSMQSYAQSGHWYSLTTNEQFVCEMLLAPEQATNIVVQYSEKVVLGFKSDVPVSYAAQNRDLYVTLRSTNTFGKISSGLGGATRFNGSPEGIHLLVTSDFSFPVRIVIYREAKK